MKLKFFWKVKELINWVKKEDYGMGVSYKKFGRGLISKIY